ncbi:MAG TPA: hypothetical protein VGF76_05375, partial [Polyangiaceae bacterium]
GRVVIMTAILAVPALAWSGCINLGGDSCHGTPDDCHDQNCANVTQYGCVMGPGCFSRPCPSCIDTCASNNQVACSQQSECTWDVSPTACTGGMVKTSCLGMEEDECKKISGCTWGSS